MKKQDFTIEGSVALKKAFIEECGHDVFRHVELSKLKPYYLTPCCSEKNFGKLTFAPEKKDLHFNLNTQYGEALEYVKEYFKPEEPEFKVGDIVVVTERHSTNCADVGCLVSISEIDENSTTIPYKVKNLSSTKWKVSQEQWCVSVRHATPEEIEEYNNPKLPEINGYEGYIEYDCVNYGCKSVSFKDIKRLQKVWEMFSKNVNEKELILDSDKFKIKKSELDQIIKVVNAKTK